MKRETTTYPHLLLLNHQVVQFPLSLLNCLLVVREVANDEPASKSESVSIVSRLEVPDAGGDGKRKGKGTHFFSRHLLAYSSLTLLKIVAEKRTNSSSSASLTLERGTTNAVRRS